MSSFSRVAAWAAPSRRSGSKRALEQGDELRGDRRVVQQHLLDVGLAEGHADLQQVAAVRAQHHHVAPAEPGGDHRAG